MWICTMKEMCYNSQCVQKTLADCLRQFLKTADVRSFTEHEGPTSFKSSVGRAPKAYSQSVCLCH